MARSPDRLWIQESKKACCARNTPPTSNGNQPQSSRYQAAVKSPAGCCTLRRCKYAKSQIHQEFSSAQRLLDKIQYLKKSIQDLETSQKQFKPRSAEKKDAPSQTHEECTPPDLNNVREIVNNCITEMTRLKKFLDDENCWWKMFKKRDFNCCDQKLPHLHGFLDGTMVTLKMLEENLERDHEPVPSTAATAGSLTYLGPDDLSDPRGSCTEHCIDDIESRPRVSADAAVSPRQSVELESVARGPITDQSCQEHCQKTCSIVKHSTPLPGQYKPPEFEKMVRISEMPPVAGPLDYSLEDLTTVTKHDWIARSSIDLRQRPRPSHTFSSENMARKHIIAADIGTSMDLLADTMETEYRDLPAVRGAVEKSFALNPFKSFARTTRSKSRKENQHTSRE